MASELQGSALLSYAAKTPAKTPPQSSIVGSKMGTPGNHAGNVKKDFRPEDDPQFSCCIKLNLHRSVIVTAVIMFSIHLLGAVSVILTRSVARNLLIELVCGIVTLLACGSLLVGSVWRIAKLYYVYGVLSAVSLIITLWVMIAKIEVACSVLLGDLRKHPTEQDQEINTYFGKYILLHLLFLSFVVSLHFYLFYIVWRDYNFIKEYPRKKNIVTSESQKLLNDK